MAGDLCFLELTVLFFLDLITFHCLSWINRVPRRRPCKKGRVNFSNSFLMFDPFLIL